MGGTRGRLRREVSEGGALSFLGERRFTVPIEVNGKTSVRAMGKQKLNALLKAGKITKSEHDQRVAQSEADRNLPSSTRKLAKGVRKLAIPGNEQDAMIGRFAAVESKQSSKYLASLVCPKYNMARVPDSYARPTALVRSIQVFDIPCVFTGAADDGRFACFIRPCLGDTSSPLRYKVGCVDSLAGPGWPTDLTVATAYLEDVGGVDPRLDPFYAALTQPGNFFEYLSTTGLLAASTSILPGAIVESQSSYGLRVLTVGNPVVFTLPVGTYFVSYSILGTGIGAAGLVTGGTAVFSPISSLGPDSLFEEYAAWGVLTVNNPTDTWSPTIVSTGTLAATLAITPMFSDSYRNTANFGSVKAIRPVGMSALATYVGPQLTNGGNISCAYCPEGTVSTGFVANVAQQTTGSLADWSSLAKLPEAFNGPLMNGAYCWWAPEDFAELALISPDQASSREWPALLIAGVWTPGGTPPATAAVVRLEIVSVYEFVTTSLLYESESCVGSQAELDLVNRSLVGQPHAMANGSHLEWLKNFAKKTAKFLKDNKDWILPAAKGLAATLL